MSITRFVFGQSSRHEAGAKSAGRHRFKFDKISAVNRSGQRYAFPGIWEEQKLFV
jgi:hypothetical protein